MDHAVVPWGKEAEIYPMCLTIMRVLQLPREPWRVGLLVGVISESEFLALASKEVLNHQPLLAPLLPPAFLTPFPRPMHPGNKGQECTLCI